MFSARNISLGARADRRRRAAAEHQKRKPSARRGVDRKAGRFFSPRLRVLLWSFLPTREESGVPKTEESRIHNPANPQICRRWVMQGTWIDTGISHPRGGGCRKCTSARNEKILRLSLRMTGRDMSCAQKNIPAVSVLRRGCSCMSFTPR